MSSLAATRLEMGEYVATCRLTIVKGGPIGRTIGSHTMEGNFSISFDVDKLYSGADKEEKLKIFPYLHCDNIPGYNFPESVTNGTLVIKTTKSIFGSVYAIGIYEIRWEER
jgi:hypothetical protein